jgi:hypothetical protein
MFMLDAFAGVAEHAAERALADRDRDRLAGAGDDLDQQAQVGVDAAGALSSRGSGEEIDACGSRRRLDPHVAPAQRGATRGPPWHPDRHRSRRAQHHRVNRAFRCAA